MSDVIVVGGGASGLSAALEAARLGLRVELVEVAESVGGAAAWAGGGICLVGSTQQQARGISDSVPQALSDWLAWGGPTVDAEWAARYLAASAESVGRWLEGIGVSFDRVDLWPGNSVPRMHFSDGKGEGIIEALLSAASTAGAKVTTGTWLTKLEPGAAGVTATLQGPDGRIREERVAAVIMATGGFCGDHARISRNLTPQLAGGRVLAGGAPTAVGLGHDVLAALGVEFTHLSNMTIYPWATPEYRDPTGARGLSFVGGAGELWFNRAGRRFHNESVRDGNLSVDAVLAQPGHTFYSVYPDAEIDNVVISAPEFRNKNRTLTTRAYLDASPYARRAGSYEALAALFSEPASFLAEIALLKAETAQGRPSDNRFGRPLAGFPKGIWDGPVRAIECHLLARKSLGGVRTDHLCRPLRPGGTAIPHVYAVGEVAGMAGGHINGKAGLEGTMLGPCILSGRIAGRSVVRDVVLSSA